MTSERFRRNHREAGRGAAAAEAFLQGKAIRQEIVGLGEVDAAAPIAADLGVTTGDAVFVRRRRLLLDDGTPLQLCRQLPAHGPGDRTDSRTTPDPP